MPVASSSSADQPPAELGTQPISWPRSTGAIPRPARRARLSKSAPTAAGVVSFEVLGSHTYASQGHIPWRLGLRQGKQPYVHADRRLGSCHDHRESRPDGDSRRARPASRGRTAGGHGRARPTRSKESRPRASSRRLLIPIRARAWPTIRRARSRSTGVTAATSLIRRRRSSSRRSASSPTAWCSRSPRPHTYGVAGNYTVSVTITRSTVIGGVPTPGSSAVAISNEIVADAPLSPTRRSQRSRPTKQRLIRRPSSVRHRLTIRASSSPDRWHTYRCQHLTPTTPPSAVSQEFMATIDWGDSSAQSVRDGDLRFRRRLLRRLRHSYICDLGRRWRCRPLYRVGSYADALPIGSARRSVLLS